jgi:hypothetical protein
LLRILSGEGILMVPPLEWARDRCVPIFDVKTTSETCIPIVVYLIDVGEIRVTTSLVLDNSWGRVCHSAVVWNESRSWLE